MNTFFSVCERLSRLCDSLSELSGRLASWLVLALILLISYDVAMRYLLHSGSVALQELEWHLFSAIFLLGASYTLKYDAHVRVDLIYRSPYLGTRGRAWIDFLGHLLLLMPFSLLIITTAVPFVENAFVYQESSPDPGGLPFRWILKALIPLAFVLLLLQGIGQALRNLWEICGGQH